MVLYRQDQKAHHENNTDFPIRTATLTVTESILKTTPDLSITPAASDFLSLDDPSMTVTGRSLDSIPGMLGPRKADGIA